LIVPADDPGALVDALEQLATAPDAAAAMGRRGRDLAQSRFSLSSMVDQYHALYGRHLRSARPQLQGV